MQTKKWHLILSYGIAVISVITALVVLLWMSNYLQDAAPVSVLLCSVIFSTRFGGIRQGLLSVLLSTIVFDYYFLPPIHSFAINLEQFPRLLFFMVPAFFIVWLSSVQKRMKELLLKSHNVLEVTVEKLVQNETKLKEAQAIAHIGNWEIGLQNGINIWSDEVFKILGMEPGEMKPDTEAFLSFIHPDDLVFVKSKINSSFVRLTATYFNFRFIKKDGEIRYGSSVVRFELDDEQKPIRAYGIIRDITEQKLEAEKKDKMLKSLEEILFLTSHRVRQPVTSILGVSSLLDNTDLSKGDLKKIVAFMKISAQSLDVFTKELTTFITHLHETNKEKVD
ncbi:MAG: sensor hybrid histidine kinase [Bacteroidetes bacterium]|nr:sensor hybrid histidine kinase [Bacteroidota bacterium]